MDKYSREEIKKIDFINLDTYSRFLKLYNLFNDISDDLGCDSYDSMLAITYLIEYHTDHIYLTLESLLCNFLAIQTKTKKDTEIAFLAFYALAIIMYRKNNNETLKNHILKFENYFKNDFPLFYDAALRYFLNMHDYKSQLKAGEKIAEMQKEKGVYKINTGDKNSFVVAVTGILGYYLLRGTPEKTSHKDYGKPLNKLLSFKKIDYYYSEKELNKMIEQATIYAKEIIEERSDYPRYYSYKAAFLFYKSLYLEKMLTEETKNEIIELIDTAIKISKDNNQAGIGLRDSFLIYKDFINSFPTNDKKWKSNKNYEQMRVKSEIGLSESLSQSPKPQNYDGISDYAFISYSSKDYKIVYSDLVELNSKGIVYNYDSEMIPELKNDKNEIEEWYKIVEDKVKKCVVAICFISENFISSDAVIKELEFIHKYNKPIIAIDLSGLNTTGRIIKSYLNSSNNVISTDKLFTISQVLNDNVSNIQRGNKIDTTAHIQNVYKWIDKNYSSIIKNVVEEHIVKGGNKHPLCEDYALVNNDIHLFIIADGVSRNNMEYANKKYLAKEVAELFSNSVLNYFNDNYKNIGRNHKDIKKIIFDSLLFADAKIKEFNEKNKENILSCEKPGCCFVVGLIYNNKLYFAGAGDSTIFLIRNKQVIKLFSEQTDYAFKVLKIESNRDLLIKQYVNNKENDFGYGLANGELNKDLIQYSVIELNFDDVLLFTSDGASKYIEYARPVNSLITLPLEELINRSNEFDKNYMSNIIDDKSIIRVKIGMRK